ncbi:MAG: CvpA family protein [Muribaculaceae bacterium]|nr:CvpA family protein [Muribaculaceae bacterium]
MSVIDILIIVVFVASILLGLKKGFIGQLSSVAAIVGALIGCRIFGGVLEPLMPQEPSFVAPILSHTLMYVALYFGIKFVAKSLKKVTHALMMGPLDRVCGAIVSVFKWMLGLSLVLNAWLAVFPNSTVVKESTLGGGSAVHTVMEIAPWFWGFAIEQYENNGKTLDVYLSGKSATDSLQNEKK